MCVVCCQGRYAGCLNELIDSIKSKLSLIGVAELGNNSEIRWLYLREIYMEHVTLSLVHLLDIYMDSYQDLKGLISISIYTDYLIIPAGYLHKKFSHENRCQSQRSFSG